MYKHLPVTKKNNGNSEEPAFLARYMPGTSQYSTQIAVENVIMSRSSPSLVEAVMYRLSQQYWCLVLCDWL